MRNAVMKSVRSTLLAAAVVLAVLALPVGCNDAEFCCLEYERGTPELSYCNSHSRAAGHFLLDAEEVSSDSLGAALTRIEELADDASDCRTIECIESLISDDPGLVGLWSSYEQEHAHADSALAADGIEFDESKRMQLIRCGFTDAVGRTKKNVEEGR